ncbi:N(G),N(G)-dimethylarginine dimethylaminohydrolase 1 [Daktulosphaira vitifoliae]|uniref:N(G),N(G)-dimethylarginine dimethylaminohydrolase 1 n=1 Tax=Daktulosphaira vitifoliae TaxID=58002 RepID=UPI0021AAE253|nr:N(G),N(G)-dimethylarginine dimethylaminohydrolase 1 [Daktulosphaira vitifoliae]
MPSTRYTHAVVCRVPHSLKEHQPTLDYDRAKRQHENYVRTLRDIGLDVIEMPPDETTPWCAFVDDTAFVCNGTAILTKPVEPERAKEVETIRSVLKKEIGLPIVEVADKSAKLHGSDILFTGREFFIGITKWTNESGACAVASAFPEYPCAPIKIMENKHLKTIVSMAGPDLMCVGSSSATKDVLKRLEREATYSYQIITLPEDEAANVLYINGTLLHRSAKEIPQSFSVLAEKISDFSLQSVDISELLKCEAVNLNSCCLLVRRTKHIRSL